MIVARVRRSATINDPPLVLVLLVLATSSYKLVGHHPRRRIIATRYRTTNCAGERSALQPRHTASFSSLVGHDPRRGRIVASRYRSARPWLTWSSTISPFDHVAYCAGYDLVVRPHLLSSSATIRVGDRSWPHDVNPLSYAMDRGWLGLKLFRHLATVCRTDLSDGSWPAPS